MNTKRWWRSALWLALTWWWMVSTAHAVVVTGRFTGTLENVFASEWPQLAFDGDTVTGTFGFDTEAVRTPDGWWSDDPRLTITADVPGEAQGYGWPYYADPASGFSAGVVGDAPYVWLTAGWGHSYADLFLVGAAGPFTDDGQLATFRLGPVDAARSWLHLQNGLFYWSADVRLTEVYFDAVSAPVPEPATWGLLLAGMVLLPAALRTRRAAARH